MKRNANYEIALIKSGNTQKNYAAIKVYAYTPEAQCELLEAGNEAIRDLYLDMRHPCPQFVGKLIKRHPDEKEVIKKACIGNALSADNEAAFVWLFQNELNVIEEYVSQGPFLAYPDGRIGPKFSPKTMDLAKKLGIEEQLLDMQTKYIRKQDTSSKPTLGDLFLGVL